MPSAADALPQLLGTLLDSGRTRLELRALAVSLATALFAGVLRGAVAPAGPGGRTRTLRRVLKLAWLATLAWRRLRPSPPSTH